MFYRKRLLIGLILSLSFLFTSPAFAESYTSIQQIVETTPERWTETYETKWRTIQVDAEIIVPNVETFPIITIQKMPKLWLPMTGIKSKKPSKKYKNCIVKNHMAKSKEKFNNCVHWWRHY